MASTRRDKIKITYSQPDYPFWVQLTIQMIEYASGRRGLEQKLNRILDKDPPPIELWGELLQSLNISLDYDASKLAQVEEGPLVMIANHPFGVVDGLAFGYLASTIRSRFKFLVNAVLCQEEKLNEFFLPVDFENSKEALKTNIETRKVAIERIMTGEPILIFPSGGVATAPRFWMKAEDLQWKKFVIKLIRKSKATVLPVYFPGQNSRLFHLASQINLKLRLSLLLREVKNKQNMHLKIQIGDPITADEWGTIKNDELLGYLKNKVELLATHK